MAKVVASIGISRPHGNHLGDEGLGEGGYICIEITDEVASVRIGEVRIGLAEFAEALTGLRGVLAHFHYKPKAFALIGTRHEHKAEMVNLPREFQRDREAIRAALAPYEVDGWKAHALDAENWHNRKGDQVRVSFFRHVRADGTPVVD